MEQEPKKGNHIFNALDKDLWPPIQDMFKNFYKNGGLKGSIKNELKAILDKLAKCSNKLKKYREPKGSTTDLDFEKCHDNEGYTDEYKNYIINYIKSNGEYNNAKEYGNSKEVFKTLFQKAFLETDKNHYTTNLKYSLRQALNELVESAKDIPLYNFLVDKYNNQEVKKRWENILLTRDEYWDLVNELFDIMKK
ncbi:MAG: hypothetical protein AB8E82_10785 [Aureispira sp.]